MCCNVRESNVLCGSERESRVLESCPIYQIVTPHIKRIMVQYEREHCVGIMCEWVMCCNIRVSLV